MLFKRTRILSHHCRRGKQISGEETILCLVLGCLPCRVLHGLSIRSVERVPPRPATRPASSKRKTIYTCCAGPTTRGARLWRMDCRKTAVTAHPAGSMPDACFCWEAFLLRMGTMAPHYVGRMLASRPLGRVFWMQAKLTAMVSSTRCIIIGPSTPAHVFADAVQRPGSAL